MQQREDLMAMLAVLTKLRTRSAFPGLAASRVYCSSGELSVVQQDRCCMQFQLSGACTLFENVPHGHIIEQSCRVWSTCYSITA